MVIDGAYERATRMAEEERGTIGVTVLVVRETAGTAEEVAAGAELTVLRGDWEPYADAGAGRIVGLDAGPASFKERDGSGRFVWGFDVACTVVREL